MPDVRGFGLERFLEMQPLRFATGDGGVSFLFWNDVSRRKVLFALRRACPAHGS